MKNIIVFASGSGSNFQAIIDAIDNNTLRVNISALITNKPGIGAIKRAEKHSIPVYVIIPGEFDEYETYTKTLLHLIDQFTPDLIVLAGYLKKIPEKIIELFEGKIINIHPSLLPKYGGKGFYGFMVHQAVLNAGETETGCSVHYVTANYDEGPVIARAKVPVKNDDTPQTLSERVLEQEHKLLPSVIAKLLNQKNV